MKNRIPYIVWRKDLDTLFPKDRHIGDDLLLVDFEGDEKHSMEPFISDVTVSIILTSGWAKLSVNMQEYTVEAQSAIIILKDRIVRSIDHSEDMSGFALIMSDRILSSMFDNMSLSAELYGGLFQNPVVKFDTMDAISFYKKSLENLLASESCMYKFEAAKHLTLALFYGYMLAKHKETIPESRSRNEVILGNFLQIVEKEYTAHRNVIWYADKMCISPKYLSMAVKEASGKTPLDWIEEYCISAAKSMLSSTRMTMDEISIKLNFASQALFSKFFRRVAGCSPSEYRKSLDV